MRSLSGAQRSRGGGRRWLCPGSLPFCLFQSKLQRRAAGDAAQDSLTSRGFRHIQRRQRRSADKLRDGFENFTIF